MAGADRAIADGDEHDRATTLDCLADPPIKPVIDVETFLPWDLDEKRSRSETASGLDEVLHPGGGEHAAFSENTAFRKLRVDTLVKQRRRLRSAVRSPPEKTMFPDRRHDAGGPAGVHGIEEHSGRGWRDERTGALRQCEVARREVLRRRDELRHLIERHRIARQLRRPKQESGCGIGGRQIHHAVIVGRDEDVHLFGEPRPEGQRPFDQRSAGKQADILPRKPLGVATGGNDEGTDRTHAGCTMEPFNATTNCVAAMCSRRRQRELTKGPPTSED